MSIDTRAYWNDRLRDSWNLTGVGYRALGAGFNRWAYRVRRFVFRQALPAARPGARAYDVGSGTGFYVEELLRAGYRVTGNDISSVAIASLRQKFPNASFEEGDVADRLEGSYDRITAMDVLFHIVDDDKYHHALSNIARALAPGGVFVFSDNFPHTRVAHPHQASRSESEIIAALAAAGLTIRSRRPFFVLMNAPVKKGATVWWTFLQKVLGRLPFLGGVIGATLFPVELLAVSFARKTTSTEIVVCVKKEN